MGRERQKKKNRSSISKVRQKPKSKKRLLAHPIIAENWDKTQTLAQNYKRLGLSVKLNKTTGGVEKKLSDIRRLEEEGEPAPDALNISSSGKRKEKLDVTEAKIERDEKTGKILRVVEQSLPKANGLNDPLADLDSDSEDEVFNLRNQHGNTREGAGSSEAPTETVRRLQEEAAKPAAKYKRKMAEGEIAFVEELVSKYGDDYGKMARDMKINYMQRSEGDLKKRIKKWREAGGTVG